MITSEKDYNFLKCENTKKAKKDYYKIINEYVKKSLPFGYLTSAPLDEYYIDKLPESDARLVVRMVSSENEPKVYCFIYDEKHQENIYISRILSDTPETYGTLATVAGAYLDAINKFMFYNDLF